MIEVKRTTEKEKVYEWVKKAEQEKNREYLKSNLTLFIHPIPKMNEEFVLETMEKKRYLDSYFYYFVSDHHKTIGFFNFVVVQKRGKNYLRVIYLYLPYKKKEAYPFILDELERLAKEKKVEYIEMCTIFTDRILQSYLEKRNYLLNKASFTINDFTVEKKLKPFGFKISFLGDHEKEELEEYLKANEYEKKLSSFTLVAKKRGKLVGILSGKLGVLGFLIGDNERIKHELLNEFKRICLRQDCDDILVETNDISLENFYLQEGFLEKRRSYFRLND